MKKYKETLRRVFGGLAYQMRRKGDAFRPLADGRTLLQSSGVQARSLSRRAAALHSGRHWGGFSGLHAKFCSMPFLGERCVRFGALGLLFVFCFALSGCALIYRDVSDSHSGPRGKAYTVRGKTYRPLLSADGFREEGVASWYGPNFHGKKTANGERYNMYAMTAAHKLLPLGTSVRVTHLSNGRSIIVRINDRGPFVEDRIIDLSYTAAQKLNLVGKGTGRVRVEAVGSQAPPRGQAPPDDMDGSFYIQVAAMGSRAAAEALVRGFKAGNLGGRAVFAPSLNLWRVQAGPFRSLTRAEDLADELKARFPGCYVVSD